MNCKECGRQIPEGAMFCKYCGARAEVGETSGNGKNLNFEKGQKGVRRSAAKKGSGLIIALVVILIVAIGVLAAVLLTGGKEEPAPEGEQVSATTGETRDEVQAETWTASLLPQNGEVEIGKNLMLNATVDQELGSVEIRSITWQSSDPAVATVSDGIVYGMGAGETTITAQLALSDGSSVECQTTVNVLEASVVYTATLSPEADSLRVGDVVTLVADLEQDLEEGVEVLSTVWTSNNKNVAVVSNGKVSAIGTGSATISVTINLSNAQAASANAAITVVADQASGSSSNSGTAGGNSGSSSNSGSTSSSGNTGSTGSSSNSGSTSSSGNTGSTGSSSNSGSTSSSGTPSGSTSTGGDKYSTYNDYVLPGSNNSLYSYETLRSLSDWELRVARNEIYARHGRTFNDADLQAHFNSKSWYNGTIAPDAFDASVLNKVELENIDRIKEVEASR